MLITTKEHTRQRSETFSLGLFTLIVKKPGTFPKQLVEGDLILARTESYVSVPAWPVRRNNFTGLAKFQSQ